MDFVYRLYGNMYAVHAWCSNGRVSRCCHIEFGYTYILWNLKKKKKKKLRAPSMKSLSMPLRKKRTKLEIGQIDQSLLSWKGTNGLIISLCWVQGSPFHIAARSYPVQEAWGHKIVRTGKIQKLLQCCQNFLALPYQQIPLVKTIQKKYSLTYLWRTIS